MTEKHTSPRRYTAGEIAAANRISKYVGLSSSAPGGGPLYWAAGPYYPDRVRKFITKALRLSADAQLVADAIDREWERTGGNA